jgi:hypothetical protein
MEVVAAGPARRFYPRKQTYSRSVGMSQTWRRDRTNPRALVVTKSEL